MRAIVVVFVSLTGCVNASTTPLAPEGAPSTEPEAPHRDKVTRVGTPAPQVVPAEPASSAPGPVTAASAPPPEPAPSAAPVKGAPTIQLLSAGAEPRKALRYVFHQGESVPFRMRMDMVMDSTVSASGLSSTQARHSIHQNLPTIECDGVTNTKQVDADGTAHRSGSLWGLNVIARPGVLPALQSQMEEMMRGVGKIPFDDVIDSRGQVIESHMDLSAVHEPTMLESMRQMTDSMSALTTPWPVEPVGVGAKWEIVSNVGKGKNFARDVIVTFVALKGTKLKLELATTVTGAPSSFVKNGSTVNVKATSSTGTGKIEVSLDPVFMHSTSTTRTRTDTSTKDVEIQMDVEIVTDLHTGQ